MPSTRFKVESGEVVGVGEVKVEMDRNGPELPQEPKTPSQESRRRSGQGSR